MSTPAHVDTDPDTVRIPRVEPSAGLHEHGRHRAGELGPAESRGELSTADQVVEKIAATALGEIDEFGGAARRVLGLPVGSDQPDHRPRVTATVHGALVDLDVRATVAYPAPIAQVADRARAHVVARVGELTTVQVRRVDITIAALSTEPTVKGRELR